MQNKKPIKSAFLIISLMLSVMLSNAVHASNTVPLRAIYEGRLLDNTGTNPINTSQTLRFSIWSAAAVAPGDVSGGSVNTSAPNYGGWQEVQTTTPNNDGFFSLNLFSIELLEELDHTKHLYLQVEVKPTGAPDSDYEILDRNPNVSNTIRAAIGSVLYAYNADMLDYHEVGTSDGDIVVLESGDVFPISTIPGGTEEEDFILDYNNTALGSIQLQFGNTLSKILSYDIANSYFNFNDDVNIQGDLTLTGTINGVNITALDSSVSSHLDGGPSKHKASEIDVEATDGNYYFAGDLETVIDDLDQAINNFASGNKKITISSEYNGVSYKPDGSNNVGRLYIDNDFVNGRNYYVWRTTRSDLQDYDVIIQIPVPSNFTGWVAGNPWNFTYRSTTADPLDNKADIYIYDTAGNPVVLSGTGTNLASTTWANTALGYTGSPVFNPGETFLIVIKMHSKNNNQMQIGEMTLDYK